jgi:hypothetical protein
LGRFAQADSIIPLQQGVQAWDRYAYVNNSPVNYVDPTGHIPNTDDCGPDNIYCGGLAENDYYHRPAPSNNGGGGGGNNGGNGGCHGALCSLNNSDDTQFGNEFIGDEDVNITIDYNVGVAIICYFGDCRSYTLEQIQKNPILKEAYDNFKSNASNRASNIVYRDIAIGAMIGSTIAFVGGAAVTVGGILMAISGVGTVASPYVIFGGAAVTAGGAIVLSASYQTYVYLDYQVDINESSLATQWAVITSSP